MALRIASRLIIFGAGRDIEFDIRNELLAHLERMSPSYYGQQSTGDIVSRASNDIGNIRLLYGPAVLNIVNTGFMLIAAFSMMLIIDVRLTLLALVPMPIVYLILRKIAASLARQFFEVQKFLGQLSGQIQEIFAGVAILKAFARESWARDAFDQVNAENFVRNLKLAKTRGIMLPMMGLMGGLGTLVILFFGGQAVIEQRISLGDFVAFNAYLAMLVWPMLALGWVYTMLQRGLAAARRVTEVLHIEPEITTQEPALALPPKGGFIELRHVSSRYAVKDSEPNLALADLNLRISQGSLIGITGPVGAGKTTLLRMLMRLQDFDEGEICIEGIDIRRLRLEELRLLIGYVPQEPFLFSTTIRENIAFGNRDLSEAALDELVEMADLTKDIARLPKGYDTLVGERGVTLSGGQRQRIALARALARNPRILLLDDALSSVDAETEEQILTRITGFLRQRTSLVATHRLGGIRKADHIIVLDQGRIVEMGTHRELLKNRQLYHRLCVHQQLARELEETEG
jgi:ATP-binding cassette, subfamily B, multidrug efflux pump